MEDQTLLSYTHTHTAIFDQSASYKNGFQPGAKMTIDGSSNLHTNTALKSKKTSLVNIGPLGVQLAESQWVEGQSLSFPQQH